jgi:TetR/AcrR family transcriptional regulator, tetracycline repressor protein
MARPPQPLISRAAAVQASIEIIDAEGLDAFSLPRLAKHMGVSAPSLYHHFTDRNEIIKAVARHIGGVAVTRPRRSPGADWPEYFVALGLNFRTAVLRHRNAAPLLIEYLPRQTLVDSYEDAARFLSASGVPAHLHLRILDGVETLCIGAVLAEVSRRPRDRSAGFAEVDLRSHPYLAKALAANESNARELFVDRIRGFLRGVMLDDAPAAIAEQTSA